MSEQQVRDEIEAMKLAISNLPLEEKRQLLRDITGSEHVPEHPTLTRIETLVWIGRHRVALFERLKRDAGITS